MLIIFRTSGIVKISDGDTYQITGSLQMWNDMITRRVDYCSLFTIYR